MKKSMIIMAGLVGLALTSCDDKSDLGVMQKNEAPTVVAADGVALQSLYASTGNKIDLGAYEETLYIPLIDIELSTDFPAESTVTGLVEISDNADFTNAQTIALESMEASAANPAAAAAVEGETRSLKGYVEMTAWEEAFTAFYGYNPAPAVNYLRYNLRLTNGDQNVILYDKDGNEWWDAMEFMVTPVDVKFDVAPAYTLFYTISGETHTVDMYHNPEMHEYDDPNFNAIVEVTENGEESANVLEWWLAPSDNLDRTFGVMGQDNAALKGALGELAEGATKGQIDVAGTYKIEVNMVTRQFNIQLAPPSLYAMYGSGTFANVAQLGTDDFVTYSGMAGLLGNFSLTGQAKYTPTLYVNDPAVTVTEQNGTYTGGLAFSTGGATDANNNAISYGGKAGLFYLTANLQTLKWTRYYCSTVGVTGSMEAQNWGAGPDIALKGSRTTQFMQWTGTLTLAEGDEWKIRANDEWTVNFGGKGSAYATDGSQVELVMGGDNFVAAESGTFTVTVYLKRQLVDGKMTPYYMTVTK